MTHYLEIYKNKRRNQTCVSIFIEKQWRNDTEPLKSDRFNCYGKILKDLRTSFSDNQNQLPCYFYDHLTCKQLWAQPRRRTCQSRKYSYPGIDRLLESSQNYFTLVSILSKIHNPTSLLRRDLIISTCNRYLINVFYPPVYLSLQLLPYISKFWLLDRLRWLISRNLSSDRKIHFCNLKIVVPDDSELVFLPSYTHK